jgi:exodeoxyribonuclease V gamma subunit
MATGGAPGDHRMTTPARSSSPTPGAGFYFQHSNSLARLAACLAAEVAEAQRQAPLVPLNITIPHAGVGIWLKHQLAATHGVAANLGFQQPTELVWRLARQALDDPRVDQARALDADALTLALHEALRQLLATDAAGGESDGRTIGTASRTDPAGSARSQGDTGASDSNPLAPVRRYLQRTGGLDDDKSRMGLAAELARLFRDTLIYRPHWIDAWSHGQAADLVNGRDDERWQRCLWQRVWATASGGHPEHNPGALLTELLRTPAPAGPPMLLFGISHLPPVFIDVLAWAATARAVHLFMPSPCREYWGEETDERRRLRQAIASVGELPPDALTSRDTIPNDLLAAMGRMGQEFLGKVCERLEDQLPETAAAGYHEADAGTRLGWLQRALLDLEAPLAPTSALAPPAPPVPAASGQERADSQEPPGRQMALDLTGRPAPPALDLRRDDGTIQLHACHSRLREVEVLHDQVLAWLDPAQTAFDPPLRARDIIVVAPDIDAYAPFVRAVFGTRTQGRGPVPFNLSDRKPVDVHPIVQAFLEVLDLPTADFEAESIIALLETPAIARRLGLADTELARIRQWAAELHVHWGVDGAHRRERSQGELPEVNSWRHALDRLLLGLASMQETAVLAVGGSTILPWPEVEGSAAEAAGKLAAWIARLDTLRRHLRARERTAAEWQAFLNRHLVEALFRPAQDDRDELAAEAALRDTLDELAAAAERGGITQATFTWSAIREFLHKKLSESVAQRRFLSRGITFANTVPLRAVPARIVCMLGMNAGEFPRAAQPRSFDLLERNRAPGDRTARDEDRYLFLETILAASDCLYLSYVGRDQQENNERDPSPLVSELRSYFDRAVATGAGADDSAVGAVGAASGRQPAGDQQPADDVPPLDNAVLAITEHPLQPFSPGNFTPTDAGPARSHKQEWLPAARAARAGRAGGADSDDGGARFFDPPLTLPELPTPEHWPEVITLDELAWFFRSPAKHYLTRVLDVRLEDQESSLRSAHAIDHLMNYRIGREVNQRAIDGDGTAPTDWPDAVERLRGWLPTGRLVHELVERAYAPDLVQQVREVIGDHDARQVDIDLELHLPGAPHAVRVLGQVDGLHGDRLVRWNATQMHGARWLPVILAWAALTEHGTPPEVAVIHREFSRYKAAEPPPSLNGSRPGLINDLVDLYLRGQSSPLAFFPESAWAWIRHADKPDKARSEAERAFFPGDAFRTTESDKCAYTRALTRAWSPDDLLCGQFREAAEIVFGTGDTP